MSINAVSNSLAAVQRQSAAMDRAADNIARSSTMDVSQTPTTAAEAEAVSSSESGMINGTMEMIVASRMFSAAIKMAQTANEGIMETLRLGGHDVVGAH